MTTTRDPRLDPHPGDIITRRSPTSDLVRTRNVVDRQDNYIFYVDHNNQRRKCWISTWQEWARMSEVDGSEKVPVLDAKQLLLDRALRLADDLVLASGDKDAQKGISATEMEDVLRNEHISENDVVRAFRTGLRRLMGRLEQ